MAKFLDIKVKVDLSDKIIKPTQRQLANIQQLPKRAYDFFVRSTPIDRGNARRSTRLVGDEIRAEYAYAQRLDEGYSKQATQGMTEPTEKYIRKEFRKIFGRK